MLYGEVACSKAVPQWRLKDTSLPRKHKCLRKMYRKYRLKKETMADTYKESVETPVYRHSIQRSPPVLCLFLNSSHNVRDSLDDAVSTYLPSSLSRSTLLRSHSVVTGWSKENRRTEASSWKRLYNHFIPAGLWSLHQQQLKEATDMLRSQVVLKNAGKPCSNMKEHSMRTIPPTHRGGEPAATASSAPAPGICFPLQCPVKLLCSAEGTVGHILLCCSSSPLAHQCWEPMPSLQLHPGLAFCLPHTPHGIIIGLC